MYKIWLLDMDMHYEMNDGFSSSYVLKYQVTVRLAWINRRSVGKMPTVISTCGREYIIMVVWGLSGDD